MGEAHNVMIWQWSRWEHHFGNPVTLTAKVDCWALGCLITVGKLGERVASDAPKKAYASRLAPWTDCVLQARKVLRALVKEGAFIRHRIIFKYMKIVVRASGSKTWCYVALTQGYGDFRYTIGGAM
jgi:hypothetical protein